MIWLEIVFVIIGLVLLGINWYWHRVLKQVAQLTDKYLDDAQIQMQVAKNALKECQTYHEDFIDSEKDIVGHIFDALLEACKKVPEEEHILRKLMIYYEREIKKLWEDTENKVLKMHVREKQVTDKLLEKVKEKYSA